MQSYEDNPKIKNAMDSILKIFESDNLEVITRAVFTAPAGYERPSDKWSFMNRIFMMAAGTDDARGFNQWKQVNRYVKKDYLEKGGVKMYIFGPMIKKIPADKPGEEDKTILYGFKAIPVFRLEDTEGEDLPEAPKFNLALPCDFNAIIAEMNLTIKTSPFNGATYGYYEAGRKLISLSSPDIQVFLHELAHAVDTQILGNEKKARGQETDREVVAEFSGAVVGHMLGYKVPYGTCKQYIQAYSFRELMHQLNRCEKVIKFIVDKTTVTAPIISPAPSISQPVLQTA